MNTPATDLLDDHNDLLELLARYVSIPDTKGWDDLPGEVFTDPVIWDFESLHGAPPISHPLAEFVAEIRVVFHGFTATHHAATNPRITIDGDTAHIRAHIRAEHWIAPHLVPEGTGNCWLVVGFYDDDAVRTDEGWRIQRKKLTVTHQENAHIPPIALAEGSRILGL